MQFFFFSNRQSSLCRRSDVLVGATRHLVAPFVPGVLLLERLVPDRGVAAERAAEGNVKRHHVVDLVGERVVNLVRVEL